MQDGMNGTHNLLHESPQLKQFTVELCSPKTIKLCFHRGQTSVQTSQLLLVKETYNFIYIKYNLIFNCIHYQYKLIFNCIHYQSIYLNFKQSGYNFIRTPKHTGTLPVSCLRPCKQLSCSSLRFAMLFSLPANKTIETKNKKKKKTFHCIQMHTKQLYTVQPTESAATQT